MTLPQQHAKSDEELADEFLLDEFVVPHVTEHNRELIRSMYLEKLVRSRELFKLLDSVGNS